MVHIFRIIIGPKQGYRLRDLLIPYLLQEGKLFERSMSYEKSRRFNWSDEATTINTNYYVSFRNTEDRFGSQNTA